ncbi:MAG: potassium transporter Kef [Microbacteriaceae bacterium]|nr:potassium transporter Kef [Microbacteriaceae bacterium]
MGEIFVMIRKAGHLANVSDEPLAVPDSLPSLHDLDWNVLTENVRQHGADPDRFVVSLALGLANGVPANRADALALVSLAGWRAGALTLRDDALARAGAITVKTVRTAAAQVLGIGTDLDGFLTMQESDRFWWPDRGRHDGYVCTLGGFSGLGGPWVSPPSEARPLAEPGTFGIRTGEDWWQADIDVWGLRLTYLPTEPIENAAAPDSVSIEFKDDSYLAWLHVGNTP